MSYQNGFEDALELCIAETEDSKDKQKALMKIIRITKELLNYVNRCLMIPNQMMIINNIKIEELIKENGN